MSEQQQTQLATVQPTTDLALLPRLLTPTEAKERLEQFQALLRAYLKEGEDYGQVPGTGAKDCLFKSGADKLAEAYGLSDDYDIEYNQDLTVDPPLLDYTLKCYIKRKDNGQIIATGVGNCNSWEAKYRWRQLNRLCPACGVEAIFKSKYADRQTGDYGWYCNEKKGGCKQNFHSTDRSIVDQKVGKVPNEDVFGLKNTILKMAKKRAKVDGVLAATRSSGIFTQDVEEWDRAYRIEMAGDDSTVDAVVEGAVESAGGSTESGGTISKDDIPALKKLATSAGWNMGEVMKFVGKLWPAAKTTSTDQMPRAVYDKVCAHLNGGANKDVLN